MESAAESHQSMPLFGDNDAVRTVPPECTEVDIVVTSPGQINMAAIASLANALKRPIAELAKSIYQAPSILLPRVSIEHERDVLEACRELGLEVQAGPTVDKPSDDAQRFDLAVHILDVTSIPETLATVGAIVGVGAERAYQMLSTPPGLLLGELSEVSATALGRRFADGVAVRICHSDEQAYDLYIDPDAPRTQALNKLAGTECGLVQLGLTRDQAEQQFARLPRGSTRFIARGLVPFDVVLEAAPGASNDDIDLEPGSPAESWLCNRFNIESVHVQALRHQLPVAVAERLSFDAASELVADAQRSDLPLSVAAAGFGRYSITIVEAPKGSHLDEVLSQFGLENPTHFPAPVAEDLSDLDARWLGALLEQRGCRITYDEVSP